MARADPDSELIANEVSQRDRRRKAVRKQMADKATKAAKAALKDRANSKKAAKSVSALDPAVRDDPFVIAGAQPAAKRRRSIDKAKVAAIDAGLKQLEHAGGSTVSLRIGDAALIEALPPGLTPDDLPVKVDLETLCGLMHAAVGGYSLRRTRSLDDAAQRLRALRDDDGQADEEPDDEEPDDEPAGEPADENGHPGEDDAAEASRRIQALVEAQVADLAPGEEPGAGNGGGVSPLRRLRVDLEAAELASGPADTTAYHDFHSIQLAYPDVWAEALDPRLRDFVETLHRTALEVVRDAGLPDEVLIDEVDDLEEFLAQVKGIADSVVTAGRVSIPEEVSYLWEVETVWHLLEPNERDRLIEIATAPFGSGDDGIDAMTIYRTEGGVIFGLYMAAVEERRDRGEELLDRIDFEARRSGGEADEDDGRPDPIARLRRLMTEMAKMLTETYSFEYYAENTVNFGIVATYRQRWEPGPYQAGDMVATAPLAPGETRRLQVKESQRRSRATKEQERALWSRAGESSRTVRATSEVMRRAELSTNFTMTSEGSLQIGIGTIGGSSSFARNQAAQSQTTKSDFREAVVKASHEYRNERSLEVSSQEESSEETTMTSELGNPNNELAVTYLLYELERQYRVSEQIHALQPVILVAQQVPRPDEITEAWLLRHEWILRRVLLDDSLIAALDELHNSFAGDEVAIGVRRANWEAQVRVLENLEGEHSHWLSLKRQLNRDLIAASYRERVAEAADEAGGLLADIGNALTYDFPGAAEGALEAQRKALEEHLKWVHDELQQSAEKLASAREQLDSATSAYSEALEGRTQRRTLVDQLRVHVKDNVLYYMQAIWSHEPPDQRYFRLHNVPVLFPQASTTTCRVRPAAPGEAAHAIPGLPPRNLVIDECEPPRWDVSKPITAKLHDVADLDRPLGFKGNYMIFPLRECSLITDYMMREYVDSYFGVRDPDELSEFSLDELLRYREALPAEDRDAIDAIVAKRLSAPGAGDSTVVIPTGNLYMEAIVGSHSLLEPFKLAHRGYDAAKAREELRQAGLESLRYAARMVAATPRLDDPQTETRVEVSGDGDIDLDVP